MIPSSSLIRTAARTLTTSTTPITSSTAHHKPSLEEIKQFIQHENNLARTNPYRKSLGEIKQAISAKFPALIGYLVMHEDLSTRHGQLISLKLGTQAMLFKLTATGQLNELADKELSRLLADAGLKGGSKTGFFAAVVIAAAVVGGAYYLFGRKSQATPLELKLAQLTQEGLTDNLLPKIQQSARERQLIVYTSKNPHQHNFRGRSEDLNQQALDIDNVAIECRHLAYQYLRSDKNYARQFKDCRSIAGISDLRQNSFDKHNVLYRADSYHFLQLAQIGEKLHELAQDIPQGSQKSMLLNSENHAMAICIKHKANQQIIVKFFDPNETHIHRRVVVANLAALKKLLISDLIYPREEAIYFPGLQQAYFAVYDNLALAQLKPISSNELSYPATNDPQVLSTILHSALELNAPAALAMALQKIKAAGLTHDELIRYLSAEDNAGVPAFSKALQCGHTAAVNVYLNEILTCRALSMEDKRKLLQAAKITIQADQNSIAKVPGFGMALQNNHSETIAAFMTGVTSSNLPPEIQEDLLAANQFKGRLDQQNPSGIIPGLFIALHQGHISAIKSYLIGIKNSGLTEEQVLTRLSAYAKGPNCSGLAIARSRGHNEAAKVYIATIQQNFQFKSAAGKDFFALLKR